MTLLKVLGGGITGAFMGGVFWYLGSMTLSGLEPVVCVGLGAVIGGLAGLIKS